MDDFESNARRVLERAAAENAAVDEDGHLLWFDEELPSINDEQQDTVAAALEAAAQDPYSYVSAPWPHAEVRLVPGDRHEVWDLADAYADRVGLEVFGVRRFRFAREYDLSRQAYVFGVTYMPLEGTPTVWTWSLSQSEVLHGRDGLFELIKETIKSLYRQLAEAVGVAFPEVLEADAMSEDGITGVSIGTPTTYGWSGAIERNTIRVSRDQAARQEPAITELDGFILGQVVRHKATGEQGVVVGFSDTLLIVSRGLSNDVSRINPLAVVPGQVWQPSPRSATEASS